MFGTAAAFLLVGVLTAPDAGAVGWAPVPPGAVPPPRAAGQPPRAAAAPRAVAASLPAPIALPGPAGCTLRAAKSGAGVTLEIAPGVPYARVAQLGSIEVTLPIGRDAPAAGVSVAAGNVKLKGLATPPGLALYPARPFVVGEVLVPGPHSRLRWGEVAADRVAVEVELAKESRTEFRDVKGPLRTSRPCADLRLTSLASFDSYDAFGGRGSDLAAGLRSSAPVPIAAQPNGPTLAKLVASRKAALNEVTVIDEDAGGMVADRAARHRRSAGRRLGEAEAARQAAGARHDVRGVRRGRHQAGGVGRRDRDASRSPTPARRRSRWWPRWERSAAPSAASAAASTCGRRRGGRGVRRGAVPRRRGVGGDAAQGHAPAGPPRRRRRLPRLLRAVT